MTFRQWMAEWLGWVLLAMEMHDVNTGVLDTDYADTKQIDKGSPKYEKLRIKCQRRSVMVIVKDPEPFTLLRLRVGHTVLQCVRGVIIDRHLVEKMRKERAA